MSIRSLLRNLFGRNRSAEPPQEPDSRSAENAGQTAENSENATENSENSENAENTEHAAEARTAPDENVRKSANSSNAANATNATTATTAGRNETGAKDSSAGTTLTTDSTEEPDDSGRVPTPRSAVDDLSESNAAAGAASVESADGGAKVTPDTDRTESATSEPTSETDAFESEERAPRKRTSGKTTSEDFLDSVASTTHDDYPRLSTASATASEPEPEPEPEPEASQDTELAAAAGQEPAGDADSADADSADEPAATPEPDAVQPESELREPEQPEQPEPEVRPTEPTEASTAATPEASPNATAALSLEKVEATAPELVSLYKAAAVSLEKHGLAGQRAAVYLVLDRSGSMRRYYKDGTVQHLAEQVLGLSAHLDDDGTVPVVFFSTDIDGSADIELSNHSGRIGELHAEFGHMGRTNYHRAIEAVIEHYEQSGATDPALVIFQTDGAPTSRAAAEKALCEAADKPLFWQFVGFGDPKSAGLNFLRKLDSGLPVPEKRTVDNAGFFHAGLEPLKLSDSELYEALTEEFPEWLAAIRDAKIHP